MDLTDKKTIKNLLKSFHLWAKKGLGQNFLIDEKVVSRLSKNITDKDIVLEIGPGLGVLTKELCKKAKKVIAVEKDSQMIEVLKVTCGDCKNLEVINTDILKIDLKKYFKDQKYKIVANLPFYISSPIFRFFLENKVKPSVMTFIVQREIAEKIVKKDKLNILAISVKLYAKTQILLDVKNTSFWPAPKVEATILEITPLAKPYLDVDGDSFFKVVKTGFREKRKKLVNSLSNGSNLEKGKIRNILREMGLDENIRAEKLTMDEWGELYRKLKV